MAPRIANLSTYASRSTRHSALSSNLQMPHVFVVPPEEEQQDNPPWCCFDADEQPENNGDFASNPDIDFLDVPYLLQQSERGTPAPIVRRTSVHQPRPRALISRKLEKKQRPEAVKIIEHKPSQARQRDTWRDSDVVEVVKVKRGREALTDLEENTNVKRSKTLKARATKALRSIKNVGKGSHRTHVKELWTSSESMPGIFKGVQEQIRSQQDQAEHHPPATSTKKGTLSRANSRSLSQIFQPAKPSRPGSSFTVRVAPSVALGEVHRIPPTSSPSSLPHPRYNTNLSSNEVSSTLATDDALNRPISPSPSIKKNAKFSVRELHRLFSFSSSSLDEPSSAPTAATIPFASARISSMARTSTSTLSSDYLDVPMEEGIYADAHLLDLESVDRRSASRYRQAFRTHHDDDFSTPRRLSELSLEMRLDSLHFDALSFDPEDFDVSMEGNILR
ncbi:hypothetical protein J3R82DRAFT_5566 [Butyriboletus roseoflavus]|nr:hypothetical protein J3R82DRAFT_5566 [Butyriboletus roseoflavus]